MLFDDYNKDKDMPRPLLVLICIVAIAIVAACLILFVSLKNCEAAIPSSQWSQIKSENHSLYQRLVREADKASLYEDNGMRDAVLYNVTGDTSYATRAYNHLSWMSGWKPTRNDTRHKFINIAIIYDLIKDGLPPSDSEKLRMVLDYWTDLAFNRVSGVNHGTRSWDSDEMTGHYFGVASYALTIKNSHPARYNDIMAEIGGIEAPGSKWRETVASYAQRSAGGEWIESSFYNMGSVAYAVLGVEFINSKLGSDKFPEYTVLFDNLAKILVERLTPDFRDSFKWGDTQEPVGIRKWTNVPTMANTGAITKDSRLLWAFDYLLNKNGTGNLPERLYAMIDVKSPRTAPQGITAHNSPGVGISYFHSGWEQNDSFFASMMKNRTYVDHENNGFTTFNLYRYGGWALINPKGYHDLYSYLPYTNTMMISGGYPTHAQKIKKQVGYESGQNYLWHAGTVGGSTVKTGYYDPPKITMQEWTRHLFFVHHTDGSDSIVIFDRIDACNPLDTACMSSHSFSRIRQQYRDMITPAEGKHQWILHTNESPVKNGDVFNWTAANGEEIYLKTFIDNYSYKIINASHGASMKDSQKKKELRIIPDENNSYITLLNVIHVGSPLVAQRVVENNMEGVIVNGEKVLFNSSKIDTDHRFVYAGGVPIPEPPVEPVPEPEPEDPPATPCPPQVECPEPEICLECTTCEECQQCAPFDSPDIITATQFRNGLGRLYDKALAGEVFYIHHSRKHALFQFKLYQLETQ